LNRLSLYTRAAIALAAVAIIVSGCAGANNPTSSQGTNQGEQPYKTAYGLSSEGTTTDLYTELFGPRKTETAPATVAAAPPPAQPVAAATTPQPAQAATAVTRQSQPATASAASRQAQPTTASAAPRQVQPAPAPVQVAQQPAAPQAPPEPDVPTAYGISSNGPTTDLFTELFGPRRRDGQ